MVKKNVVVAVAVFVSAFAIGQVQAGTVTVPNYAFETIYKPNSTTITATITGWTQGVGPACPIDSGVYTFSDQTTGTLADIPGWLGYDRDGWIYWGGTYGRDQATGNLQGSVSTGNNHTPSGAYCYLSNGGGWGNPAGGLIVSSASLGNIINGATYTLSMYANGSATPIVLKLLANGTELTPSSSVWPTLSGTHQLFSRTYYAADLLSYVGQALTIVLGLDRNCSDTQSHFDDVSLTYTAPISGRNTFLVPIASSASWKDLAYLAAIPASAKTNTAGPSVIALDENGTILEEVTHYLTLYTPTIYKINTSVSLDNVACNLAQTHWTTTTRVVLVGDGDYENALCASALAARLEVPLMYFNASTGLSSATLSVIDNNLQCTTALTVNGNSTVTSQLSGIGVSQTSLANANAILGWIVSNIGAVDYFAYTNPDDRSGSWKAPKLSLAAPLLAAAHAGAVVPIAYDVDWMGTYFNYSTETTTRPTGAPSGDKWRLGTMTPVTTTYDFCITVIGDYYQYVNIDFNDDGDYGDAGEGPFLEAGNELAFDGVMFQVITGVPGAFHGPGDVTLIYPTASDMVEDLGTYFTTNGGHPEYLCIVGAFDTMPYGTEVYWGGSIVGVGDALISNVDDDVFVELATGRIVALDVTFGTLQATRSSTYNNLVNDNWKKKVVLMGGGALNMLRYASRYLQNVGFDAPYELDRHFSEGEQVYMQNRSVISHSWHSCEFGWGWGPGYGCGEPNLDEYLIEPSIAESGGCLTEAIHCYNTTPWEYMVSLQIMRRGAICHLGCTATASSCYETPRVAFWIGIAAGDTLGQAWKKSQITTEYCALADISPGWDDEAPVVLFGDPAVEINIPSSPTQTPAHVNVNGTTLTAIAPTFTLGTYDDPENPNNIYTYYGPGTYPEYWTPASNYLASYTTDGAITNMTETTSCPGGLGWPATNAWFIDEHQDGTETVYWRVRFLEWQDPYNSTIVNQLSSIAYNVTVVDDNPPTPNPATFASAPAAVSSSQITMTATTGSDATGPVQYYFDETTGHSGGTDSGWVTNPVYNDTGLSANTLYTYTVKMHDSVSPTPNVGTASSPASATTNSAPGTVTVPNCNFETIYKPDSTTITGTLSSPGWTQGVGPDCPIDVGQYNFSDQTSGTLADIAGWLGYDRDGWIAWGGSYGRDQATGNLQGSVSRGSNHTPSGLNCYLANGSGWGNAAGGLIVSQASLGNILIGATYTLSMYAEGDATPVVLKLLANGTELTPSSSVSPTLGTWQLFSRTYNAGDITSHVGQAMTIVCGVGRNASGNQSHFDDVSLAYNQNIHEMENGVLSGAQVASNNAGYTGTGFVDYIHSTGDYVELTVNVPTAGSYDLHYRYALSSGNRPLEIKVNGQVVSSSLSFPATGSWTTWGYTAAVSATLNAGNNTVRATAIGSSGANVDHLLVD